jgi:hypothetical protein
MNPSLITRSLENEIDQNPSAAISMHVNIRLGAGPSPIKPRRRDAGRGRAKLER